MQQNLITKYETAKEDSSSHSATYTPDDTASSVETTNTATQTERVSFFICYL